MILYSMTATFGKLENETLTLKPGLNVITAPNEWGKSTWCAFLTAMLYGLDTRAKSTKTNLSDKERYQPWSGSPMSGRLELNWQGRDITIQRTSQGRIPLGKFRAWETSSGLEIPELTGENCGEKLLGVERSVFIRTALIRFREMNITEDEALRRRLNNLVTTGDDNPDMDRLAAEIKVLRNKIRYHKTGLLPAAQQEGERLKDALRQRELLEAQLNSTRRQLDALEDWCTALENHSRHLNFRESRLAGEKLRLARKSWEEAKEEWETLRDRCQSLPAQQQVRETLSRLEQLQLRRKELLEELNARSVPEEPGELPGQFSGMTEREALNKALADGRTYNKLKKGSWYLLLPGLAAMLAGIMALGRWHDAAITGMIAGGILLLGAVVWLLLRRSRAKELAAFYGTPVPADWEALARQYGHQLYLHSARAAVSREERKRNQLRLAALEDALGKLTSGGDPEAVRRELEQSLRWWEELERSRRDMEASGRHLQTLTALVREVPKPEMPDKLDLSPDETARQLEVSSANRSRLEQQLGQLRGKMETLGSRETLEKQLLAQEARIESLEKTGLALTLAQETLAEAAEELQRRFAPRIAAEARTRMERLTGGRYDRLNLLRDFSLMAGTGQESVLRSSLWRSDGTVDQLYLCLRLAVSETLLGDAPLILDDALVRFDDLRLQQTMNLLKEEALHRQVIVFSCQGREANWI